MRKSRLALIWAGCAMMAVTPITAFAAPCATCNREVSITRGEVQCVIERLNKQLNSSADPIVVATIGCGKKVNDGTRLESVRQGRSASSRSGAKIGGPYLVTKSDAQCLLRKLKESQVKSRELTIDLRQCG